MFKRYILYLYHFVYFTGDNLPIDVFQERVEGAICDLMNVLNTEGSVLRSTLERDALCNLFIRIVDECRRTHDKHRYRFIQHVVQYSKTHGGFITPVDASVCILEDNVFEEDETNNVATERKIGEVLKSDELNCEDFPLNNISTPTTVTVTTCGDHASAALHYVDCLGMKTLDCHVSDNGHLNSVTNNHRPRDCHLDNMLSTGTTKRPTFYRSNSEQLQRSSGEFGNLHRQRSLVNCCLQVC